MVSVCLWWQTGQGQGRAARVNTRPLNLLAARTNRLGGGKARQGKVGRPGQLLRGKTGGPASNQTKIQFFKKFIFIIEHIKKTTIFLKKKIEQNK
jgi:hypothetical protein